MKFLAITEDSCLKNNQQGHIVELTRHILGIKVRMVAASVRLRSSFNLVLKKEHSL